MLYQSVKSIALLTPVWLAVEVLSAHATGDVTNNWQLSLVYRSQPNSLNTSIPFYDLQRTPEQRTTPVPLPRDIPSVPTLIPNVVPLPSIAPPDIYRDVSALPEPVRVMRERMLEAAGSGDIEKLRPLLGTRYNATDISDSSENTDPIEFLKSLAGDKEGREILAIIVDLLSSGYVHLNEGEDDEVYVWPYFFAMPLDSLTPPQIVELMQIVTASDFEDMKKAGGYIFYSIGLAPDGSWRFFTAGEQ